MKKIMALVLAMLVICSSAAFATDFADMPNDWSTAALTAAAENGLLSGSGGYIRPSDNMTRAEMATIMVRACGATEMANIAGFTDVKPDDWFYASMSKAVAMGAFTGADNKLNPDNPITRQEAFLVLSRVFGLNITKSDTAVVDSFKDGTDVDLWAKEGVAAIISKGYVSGDDGYLNPLSNISRAEFAVVMDRLVKYYIDDPEEKIPDDGNVMIRVPGVNLDGFKTNAMVILGDGMSAEKVKISDFEVMGDLIIRAAGNIEMSGKFGNVGIVVPNVELTFSPKMVKHIYIGKGSSLHSPIIMNGLGE